MQNKILVVGLGGTIGSVRTDKIGLDGNNLKILDYVSRQGVAFEGASPFSVLSENMTIELWKALLEYIDGIDFSQYLGVIILHGSDTLAFTSALVANAFPERSIVFVASDKPIEDESANGISNFNAAVDLLLSGSKGVYVSYDGIFKGNSISSVNIEERLTSIENSTRPVGSKTIHDKNILVINSYVGFNPGNYNLLNVDAVLIGMYHSATAPAEAISLAKNCPKPVYFATHKSSADYESAREAENIIYNSTLENAYARLLLSEW